MTLRPEDTGHMAHALRLAARGLGEERYLEPLVASLKSGKTQADRWLELFHGTWGGDLGRIVVDALRAA